MLFNQSMLVQADTLKALGLKPQFPILDLSYVEEVETNWNQFIRDYQQQGKFFKLLSEHRFPTTDNYGVLGPIYHSEQTDPLPDFFPKDFKDSVGNRWNFTFHPDGEYTCVLGYQVASDQFWGIASISFTPASHLSWLNLEHPGTFYPNAPVIVQNQFDSESKGDSELKGTRWEKFLYELIIDWAAFAKLPAVYVQPSHRNKWINAKNANNEAMR